jgi:hypothetical protein
MEHIVRIIVNEHPHMLCFENGACLFISEESLEKAVCNGSKSILNCISKFVKEKDMVRPVLALRLGFCGLCGEALNKHTTRRWHDHKGRPREVCSACMDSILKAMIPLYAKDEDESEI